MVLGLEVLFRFGMGPVWHARGSGARGRKFKLYHYQIFTQFGNGPGGQGPWFGAFAKFALSSTRKSERAQGGLWALRKDGWFVAPLHPFVIPSALAERGAKAGIHFF